MIIKLIAKTTLMNLLLVTFFCTLSCGLKNDSNTLLVYSAASLTYVVLETQEKFERDRNIKLAFNFGGSQMLASEIANGAPGDIYLSAGHQPMDFLVKRGDIDIKLMLPIIGNKLIVAVREDSEYTDIDSLDQLVLMDRIAIADPELAPAGKYAKDALISTSIMDKISDKLIHGHDVRVALAYLEMGNVDAAIVYSTDMAAATGVISKDLIPQTSYEPIVYLGVVIPRSENKKIALDYLDFLGNESTMRKFLSQGFSEIPPDYLMKN